MNRPHRTRSLLIVAVWVALLAGCAPHVRVSAVWLAPGHTARAFQKVAVVALSGERESRRIYENHVIARIADRGIPGVAGNDLFAEMPGPEQKDLVAKRFQELDIDAAIALRIIRREAHAHAVGPLVDHDSYNHDFYGTYGSFYERVHREASVEVERVIVAEAVLYDLQRQGAVAEVQLTLKDPRSIEDVREASHKLVEALVQAGALRAR